MAITTLDIHAAADKIAAQGVAPTLAAVRSALGGGSFTTIERAMEGMEGQPAGQRQRCTDTRTGTRCILPTA